MPTASPHVPQHSRASAHQRRRESSACQNAGGERLRPPRGYSSRKLRGLVVSVKIGDEFAATMTSNRKNTSGLFSFQEYLPLDDDFIDYCRKLAIILKTIQLDGPTIRFQSRIWRSAFSQKHCKDAYCVITSCPVSAASPPFRSNPS